MSRAALLSCLGVEGWGPLHLLLRRDSDPQALLQRLQQAWWLAADAGVGREPPAGRLLAALLRSQRDLEPASAALPLSLRCRLHFRHRLVLRPAGWRLHLRSWDCRAGDGCWQPCGVELPLAAALGLGVFHRDAEASPAGGLLER